MGNHGAAIFMANHPIIPSDWDADHLPVVAQPLTTKLPVVFVIYKAVNDRAGFDHYILRKVSEVDGIPVKSGFPFHFLDSFFLQGANHHIPYRFGLGAPVAFLTIPLVAACKCLFSSRHNTLVLVDTLGTSKSAYTLIAWLARGELEMLVC